MAVMEFVGQSARDADNTQVATSRLVNFYRERALLGDKTSYVLKSVLGSSDYLSITGTLRAMAQIKDAIFVVSNGSLYRIVGGAVTNNVGGITDDVNTTISSNQKDVVFCAGGEYFLRVGIVNTNPTAGAFSDFGSVTFLKNYTVLTEKDGRRIQWSDLADASTLPGINFATAESRDDDVIRAIPVGGNLWVLGEKSIEIWYVTGLSGANAFKPISGAVMDTGLLGFNLVTEFRAGAFLIGDDGVAYMTDGGALSPVSTLPVETAISEETPTHCYYYEDEGHKFCVVRFASRPAWVFDISTGEWHERAEGDDHDAWAVVATTKAFGDWISGSASGQLSTMTRNNEERGSDLRRTAVSRTLSMDQETFIIDKLEFTGRFSNDEISDTPDIAIKVSRNNGNTWGSEKVRPLGVASDYYPRATYRNMGQFRQATVEMNITDAVDVTMNAAVNVEVA